MTKYFLTLLVAIIFISCSTYIPPKAVEFDKSRTYNQSFDEIWTKLMQLIATNNIKLKTIDKDSGILISEDNKILGAEDKPKTGQGLLLTKYCDCGTPGGLIQNDYASFKSNFTIIVIKDKQGTTVTMNTHYTIRRVAQLAGSQDILQCESTGLSEKYLLDYLDK